MTQQTPHPLRLRASARQVLIYRCRKWSSVMSPVRKLDSDFSFYQFFWKQKAKTTVSSEPLEGPCSAALR